MSTMGQKNDLHRGPFAPYNEPLAPPDLPWGRHLTFCKAPCFSQSQPYAPRGQSNDQISGSEGRPQTNFGLPQTGLNGRALRVP